MKRQIFFIMIPAFFICASVSAEQVTMTTYYPAPFGAYDRVLLVPRDSAGITCDANNLGLMYFDKVDQLLKICRDDGWSIAFNEVDAFWTRDDTNKFLYPTDPADFVGIGTGFPQNFLDVAGGMAVGAGYAGSNAAPANGLLVEGNVGMGTTSPKNQLDIEGAVAIGASYSGTNIAPSNGLIVQGNVGIGTNSPSRMLHVAGAVRLGSTTSPSSPSSGDVYNDGSDLKYHDGSSWISLTSGVWTKSGSNIYYTSGNVGVNSSSPDRPLEVGGAIRLNSTAQPSSPQSGDIYNAGTELFYFDGSSWQSLIGGGGSLWQKNGSDIYYNSGRVGIGLNSPAVSLDILGDAIQITDGNPDLILVDTNDADFKITANNDRLYFYSKSGSSWDTEIMALHENGRVGIGIVNASGSYKLRIAGSAEASGGIWQDSDRRFKEKLTPISGALDKIMAVRGYSFQWKRDEYPERDFPTGRQYGVIAQEIEEILPEVVMGDDEEGKTVNYSAIVPVLIEAIKEIKVENDALKQRIQALENR